MGDQTGEQYTERELALILKRASELQGSEEPSRMRYSLAEIQDIAQGAGIDRDTVAAAAAELRRTTQSTPWLIGGPTRFRADRTADAAVEPGAFADLVDAIRAETGLQGDAKQVFDTLEWTGQDVGGHVFVTVAPRDQRTRVSVSAARTDEAVLTGMLGAGTSAAALVTTIVLGNTAGLPPVVTAVLAVATAAGTMVGATRLLWRKKMRKWTRRANEIAEAIVARLTPR